MIRFTARSCHAVALLAVTLVAGCGGGSGSPTSPTSTQTAAATRIIALSGALAFGDVAVGQTREATITISNTGTGTLTLGDLSAPASAAAFLSATLPRTVAPGASSAATIRFSPQSVGTVSGTLTFQGDQTAGTNTIAFSGTGIGAPVTISGVVTDANTRRAIVGARVAALTANSALTLLAETATDGNGFYSFVVPSATAISFSVSRSGYNVSAPTVTFATDTRRDVSLNPFWTMSGTGNTVFDMPTYVSRVRITGRYESNSTNFVVRVGGRLVVNELLGRAWGATTYNGLHLVSGGVTEITLSRDVAWTFTQEQ